MKNEENKNASSVENLRWVNPQDGANFHAGVAFYMAKYGEYKLILDAPRTVLFLKPSGATDDRIQYCVMAPVYKNGKLIRKVKVGHGYSSDNTNGHIYMQLGAYSNSLTLAPKMETSEKQ